MNPHVADVLFVAAALDYLAATALFVRYLVAKAPLERDSLLAARLVAVGAAFHAAHIVAASLVWQVCPVAGIHFPISVATMLMAAAYAVLRKRWRLDVLGAFVAPLALTAHLALRFTGTGPMDPTPRLRSAMLPVHVAMNVLGIALFSLAFAAAALFLVQERLLKKKHTLGLFKRLPPLDALDRAEHRFLLAGFPLLTLGIVTGTLFVRHADVVTAPDVARTAFGYATWLLAAAVLFLRASAGWRGRRAAYGTIAGFGFALVVIAFYTFRAPAAPQVELEGATDIATNTAHDTARAGTP
jgi:ABC-type uncharacterized transport system permease subunit